MRESARNQIIGVLMADTLEQPGPKAGATTKGQGSRAAIDAILPAIYDELRSMAHFRLRAEQTGHTLETTGLVHEAYIRLAGSERLEFESRAHFLAIAAQAMRHILIDSALTRRTQKRGGGLRPLTIDDLPIVAETRSEELRRIAHFRLRAEQTGHTLETTGLVHEAYIRLSGSERLEFESRAHFLAIAAQAMRHIPVSYTHLRAHET